MKTLIIQTSPLNTASTFLINAIYGIIPELFDKRIIGGWEEDLYNIFDNNFENIIVFKSHHLNIDELIDIYKDSYNLFFVCSERKDKNYIIDEKYKKYKNVIVFEFNELNETENNTLLQIVDNIYYKIKNLIPYLELDKQKCITRIELMNQKYNEIKSLPFSYVDDFFQLHGSHRNRDNLN
uniref:Sulfotransferase domain-containing protein n=1 Tax=viral metagenome TaxID=1070528 RepID=A0A6C0ERS8_9ZZZZ